MNKKYQVTRCILDTSVFYVQEFHNPLNNCFCQSVMDGLRPAVLPGVRNQVGININLTGPEHRDLSQLKPLQTTILSIGKVNETIT